MGRSYSFEPFTSQQPAQTYKGSGPRLGNDESKVTLAKDMEKDTLPQSATNYGQAHSETVKRYRARAQARKSAAKKATPARPRRSGVLPARARARARAPPRAGPSRRCG